MVNFNAGCSGPFAKNWPTDQPWVAMIKRGDCTFNQKIKNAESLNATGVIIYDHEMGNGGLQSMKVSPSTIPSVFTYNWKGIEIDRLVKEHDNVMIHIKRGSHCTSAIRQIPRNNSVAPSQVLYCTPEDAWEQFQNLLSKHNPFWNLTSQYDTYGVNERRSSVLFVSVSFIVLMVISVTWLVLYYVQRFRYIHAKDRLERRLCVQAKRALAIIPIITISKDDDEDDDHCPGKIKSIFQTFKYLKKLNYFSLLGCLQNGRSHENLALQPQISQSLHRSMALGQKNVSHVQNGHSQTLWAHWRQ